jgi:CBS domain-containing protein
MVSTVKDVFSKGVISVRANDTLSKCMSLFKEKSPPSLIVLNGKGGYKGVIARRWIVRSRLDPSKTKVKKLMRPAPTVKLHDSVNRAARLMLGSEVRQLPVYSGEKLVGFITSESVIHRAVTETWGETAVSQIMTKDLFVLEEDESVGAALSLFRDKGISHVPVVREGKLVGIVSVHDMIEHIFQPRHRRTRGDVVGEKIPVLSIPVKGIMSKPVITVSPEARLSDAEKRLHKFNISSLVIAKKGRAEGIVTKKDFLESIAQLEKKERGLRVQFSVKDVELDEMKRGLMMADFESFARKYTETLELGTLFVYMKTHGTNYKGGQLIHCRLQLRSAKDSFFSSSEGWGVEQTFRLALDRLERRILKSKELEGSPKFAERYLRRIGFPLTEL